MLSLYRLQFSCNSRTIASIPGCLHIRSETLAESRAPDLLRPKEARSLQSTAAASSYLPETEAFVGIDLGTTNSAIATVRDGQPVIVPIAESQRTLPSIVTLISDAEAVTGLEARGLATQLPHATFYSTKRFIGQEFNTVQAEAKRVAYAVEADEEGDVVFPCSTIEAGVTYPEVIAGHVLSKLLAAAESFTGLPVNKAVVSVPAYFKPEQVEATVTAGKIAGLETVRIIKEPIAAALAYGLDVEMDQTVLVFDLGGGTYDVSILEVGGGTVEVLSTGGDSFLGGDDWDNAIVEWVAKRYLKGLDWQQPDILSQLKAVAEYAKIMLSAEEEVQIQMPLGGRRSGKGSTTVKLTRDKLESLTAPLYKRLQMPLNQACWQAGVDLVATLDEWEERKKLLREQARAARGKTGAPNTPGEQKDPALELRPTGRLPISQILLVGGATRMPGVRRFIRIMTGLEPEEYTVDPDEAVALGAAVQAGILSGVMGDMMVMDTWQATAMRAMAMRQLKTQNATGAAVSDSGDARQAAGEGDALDEEDDWDDEGEDDTASPTSKLPALGS